MYPQTVEPLVSPVVQQKIAKIATETAYQITDVWWQQVSHLQPGQGGTFAFGVGGNLAGGAGGTGSIPLFIMDSDGSIAILMVEAGGIGSSGLLADVEAWIQATNAPTIYELMDGTDVFFGFDAAAGGGFGVDVIFSGEASTGQQIIGGELSVNLGGAVSPEFFFAPIEIHGGATHPVRKPFQVINIYEQLFGIPRPSHR